eukprot:CAMPEP_0172536498 /NCGR_PEP_ID=MMETSP1067-20121228/8254_1 /TAXON_ID=265564 ORGANISM="Thalassiosira punctigera, Strain Tpunct2005C2" /NCGR_SAMPLE_ID=MMETSP1067 /ASSEMBLY_ACC=CAM_ASM_000444 /LENGTH=536 /DNA_ID=CAMNT_0013321587 /DNA_START=68 /DNA_END=1678 /DNA_ORIENTATION=-
MRVRKATLSAAAVAATCLHSAAAFAPPRIVAGIVKPPITSPKVGDGGVYCPPLSASGPPVISNWRYDPSRGTVSGTVSNHPTIRDGERITTSAVKNPDALNENLVVQTKSGSRYKLTNIAFGAKVPAVEVKRAKEKAVKEAKLAAESKAKAAVVEKRRLAEEKKAAAAAKKASIAAAKRPSIAPPKKSVAAKVTPAPATSQISPATLRKLAKSTFSLTGTTVGPGGKYLLAGKPRQSSGRAAKIWTAYLADPDMPDVPAGFDGGDDASTVKQLTVKLSPDFERLRLENTNYDKVQSGLFSGRFVKKTEYVSGVPSSNRALDGKVSALVIESGQYDLKALLAARNGAPLRGRALRDAAASAGQCIQAVHSSGLVWTDLKTENFVVVSGDNFNREVTDADGSMGLPGVKGIDLESVIAKGGNPIDYTPEACPPEFARAFMEGYGEDFVLDYSYDMWSLGIMLYELSTGQPYFQKKSPSIVTRLLCDNAFEVDVSGVPDAKLRDLIGKCLSLEPGRRPDITGFLLHPYFITTGFGPISF